MLLASVSVGFCFLERYNLIVNIMYIYATIFIFLKIKLCHSPPLKKQCHIPPLPPHNCHLCTTHTFLGDEFLCRLCDPLPPVTAVLYYRWLAAGLHDKIVSQGKGVTESTWEFVTPLSSVPKVLIVKAFDCSSIIQIYIHVYFF